MVWNFCLGRFDIMTIAGAGILGTIFLLFYSVHGQGVEIVNFKPTLYPSGSTVISLHDIGELEEDFSNTADVLACMTNKSPCCSTLPNRHGDWTYNNGTVIGTRVNSDINYFRSRDDNQRIYLSRRIAGTLNQPTGQFCCVLPDTSDVMQTKCLEIVSTQLEVNIDTTGSSEVDQTLILTCTPTVSGGSLSKITFLKDNIEIISTTTQNTLTHTIGSLSTGDNGEYVCNAEAGTLVKFASFTLEVVSATSAPSTAVPTTLMPTTPPPSVMSVVISPTNPSGIAGEPLSLTCTATILGTGTPMFTWSGPVPQGPMAGQGSGDTYTNTLTLARVAQSFEGTITCAVQLGDSVQMDSEMLSVTVPSISATLRQSRTPTALRSYILTCEISAPTSLELSRLSYTWTRNSVTLSEQNTNTLDLSPLQLFENGARYTCQFTASSIYLSSNVNMMSNTLTLSITVLPPTAPTNVNAVPQTTSVTLTWTQSLLDVISDYIIAYSRTAGCSDAPSGSMTGSGSPYTITGLQEFIQYRITIRARNSAGTSTAAVTSVTTLSSDPTDSPAITLQSVSATSFTVIWEREPCLSRNGRDVNYMIQLRLSGTSNILESELVSVDNRMFTTNSLTPESTYIFEVAFVNQVGTGPYATLNINTFNVPFQGYLGSVSYPNNSIVNINDIGLDDNALFCYTNLPTCCRGIDDQNGGAKGAWRFPNGDAVGSRTNAPPTVFSRNRTERAIVLHRGSSTTGPTGIFTCEIPDINSRIQKIYFGIYNNSEGVPVITSLTYNTTSGRVNCISTGGPATAVTWSRSGPSYQQNKIVVDTVNATYHNILFITSSQISDYNGTFICTVSNRRGNSSMSTGELKAIELSGYKEEYKNGSSAAVSCFSNFTVQSIDWMTMSTDVNFTTHLVQTGESILRIATITRSIHETEFTCTIEYTLDGTKITSMMSFILIVEVLKSSPVVNLTISTESDSTILISWSEPVMPNGVITNYLVIIVDLKDNAEMNINTPDGNQRNLTGMNLEPGIPYNISVAAVNKIGPGDLTSMIIFTRELISNVSPKDIKVVRTSGTTMMVSWTKLTLAEARGFIKNYTIYYYPSSPSRKRQPPDAMTKVVDNESSGTIIDNLDEDVEYSVQMSVNTGAGGGARSSAFSVALHGVGTTGVPSTGSPIPIIIGVVVAIVLAIILVVIVIIAVVLFMMLRHRRTKYDISRNESVMYSRGSNQSKSPVRENLEITTKNGTTFSELEEDMDEQTYENTVFLVKDRMKPVPLKDFGAHVSRMHADRDKWFEMEYSSIEKSPKLDHDVAAIPENRARNRFGNIFPYDLNRVKLSIVPNVEHSDYINASYVDGYGRNKVYIAAQGPMENSVEDFWRMIWEQRTPTIVMLTRVFEGKKKCEEYWPENTSDPFIPCSGSSLVIELKSSLPFAEFVMKKMIVSKTDEPKSPSLEVVLFHYLGWPDHGVPANAISMINFIKRVRKSHPYSKEDLMVVHCSAGVGRTGTFITLDYMLERIKNEKTINIYEFVTDLRKQRVLMVQTPAQYIFIHNALDELLTCGDTEVAAANMRIIIGKLSRPAEPGASMSGFQKQFDILGKVTTDVCTLDFSQSVNAANTEKNRYEDRIPFNHTRVRLRPAAAQGSDYINASFVEGYRQKGAYIATQGPLPHTVNDFWRMIWEYECRCIVMLCKSEENGKEACRRYWPQGKGSSEMYGKLMVSLNDQKNMGEYMMRKLEISEHQPRMSVTPTGFSITQFQYLRWQEDIVPNTTATVLEIANLVQKVQMSTGNKPIIVMCNDGVGRSGTFICMHAQMERMKAEAVVDVFQFIKSVRFQRAGLVANKAQYEFCHQVLADFLDGFDTYANFKDII